MPEINLLEKESQDSSNLISRPGRNFSLYLTLGLLILEGLFYGYMFMQERSLANQTLEVERREASVDMEVQKIDSGRKEAVSFQGRLKTLQTLLDSHLLWSSVFVELEQNSYKAMKFEALQVDEEKHKFIITGSADTNLDIGKFMVGLGKSPYVRVITLRNTASGDAKEAGYKFTMEVTFDPKLLLKQP